MEVFIFDDLEIAANLIKEKVEKEFSGPLRFFGPTKFFDDFKKEIQKSKDKRKIIFVNVCVKRDEHDRRSYFAGIKGIIKHGLRINLLRMEPIVAYGIISLEEMPRSPDCSIFQDNPYHKYIDLKEIDMTDFKELFDELKEIPDGDELRNILFKYCGEEVKDYISSSAHDIDKTYKLRNERGRGEIVDIIKHLVLLFPEDKELFTLANEILKLLENNQIDLAERKIECLYSLIQGLKNRLEEQMPNGC